MFNREQHLFELLETLPQAVFETDLHGNLVYVNRSALEMFGYTPDDIRRGLNVRDVIAPSEHEKLMKNLGRRLAGGPPENLEYIGQRRDGTQFPVLIYSNPIRHASEITGMRGLLVDISARKREEQLRWQLETELAKAQKLDSIGLLAGGIAHDFNNILTAIVGNISLARMRSDQPDLVAQCLENAERASLRARDLTLRLLTFSRGGEPTRRPISLAKLLTDATTFALAGSNVRGDFSLAADLAAIHADEVQMLQVLHNVVLNAVQAMPDGGILRVQADTVSIDTSAPIPVPPGRYVRLEIIDQGAGIPENQLDRIFDPFFTTRPNGSGLGLTISFSIVRRHGGHVAVASKVGQGTRVTLYLPTATEPSTLAATTSGTTQPGKGRILLMDDDEIVRKTGRLLLRELGYDVLVVADGAEVLEQYTRAHIEDRPFAAVLLDLTVPGGMGGEETCRRLRQLDPRARAIVASGYATSPVMADCHRFGFVAAIAKPYDVKQISQVLHEVLAERQGP